MKKITLLLVIIFTFLFSTTSWGEWSYVEENVSGSKFYYDKDRIRKSGKFIYFWELQVFRNPYKFGGLSSTRYVQLECSIFRFNWLKFQLYNKSMGEGKPKIDVNRKEEWEYAQPNSSIDFMYNKICEEHQ